MCVKKNSWILIICGTILLSAIAAVVGFFCGKASVPKTIQIRDTSDTYQYVRPLILVDNASSTFPELNPLKDTLSSYISQAEKSGKAEDISVYYRDMITGEWTGVNENDSYSPSSMLKVGVLMAYLKIAETDPDILDQEITYTPTDDSGQYFKPMHVLTAGEYTVRDLLIQMIQQSDNDALDALNTAHPQELLSVFNALNIPYPSVNSPTDFMSPELYSRMFRALYNATYLPDVESEQALELLMQTDFTQGLVAGVATSTPVAHKFGEKTNIVNGTVIDHELHDCGIVYYSNDPYFLCVMTKGQDFPTLENIISDISKSVFNYVSSKNQS
jgi:beta-lactamase class A